MTLNKPKTVY